MMLTSKLFYQQRQASVFVIALLLATTLLIFSLTYFRVARESRAFDYRSEQTFLARDLANLIHQEAFSNLEEEGAKQNSELFWFLQGAVPGAQTEIKLPFTRTQVSKLLPAGFSCEFSCLVKVVSFVRNDNVGRPYANKFEGHGIVALLTDVVVKNDSGKGERPARNVMELHHDYLVASMVNATKSGSQLKRAILTRKSRAPFDQTLFNGNNSALIISQDTMPDYEFPPETQKIFNNPTLWKHRDLNGEDLTNLGIIDSKTNSINISGIIQANKTVEFNSPMTITGKGVMIADSFVINAPLTKNSDQALLVLFARKGKITINTSDKIEAGLIAINRTFNGTVESLRPLNLKGLLFVDHLNLNNWGNGEHLVVYDEEFARADENLQISFSPWPNFRSEAAK